MTVCTLLRCHSTTGKHKKSDQITFHIFPVDPVMANRWIEIIRRNRKDNSWKPSKSTKICSMHFRDKDMYLTKKGMRKICRGAVPTKRLFLPASESDSESDKNSAKSTTTETYSNSLPSASMDPHSKVTTTFATDNIKILRVYTADENNAEVLTEKAFVDKPEPDIHSSDLDSILDTPREHRLRRDQKRNSLLQNKHARLIKTLIQKYRRLKKRNALLEETIKTLKKTTKINIDNDE